MPNHPNLGSPHRPIFRWKFFQSFIRRNRTLHGSTALNTPKQTKSRLTSIKHAISKRHELMYFNKTDKGSYRSIQLALYVISIFYPFPCYFFPPKQYAKIYRNLICMCTQNIHLICYSHVKANSLYQGSNLQSIILFTKITIIYTKI